MTKINQYFKNFNFDKAPFLLIGEIESEFIRKVLRIDRGDLFVIEDTVIKIERIRELIHWINLKPLKSDFKVAFIAGAEKMTIEASNALLKTLEEPPACSVVILATLCEQKVIPTISSRCQKISLERELNLTKPENYLEPEKLAKLFFYERFKWVNEIAESSDVFQILSLWQEHFQKRLLAGENVLKPLKEIEQTKGLLGSNTSVKLLLENLSLNL